MRILQFTAENFKRLRIFEMTPKKRVTQLTGRNAQGKTSVLDAMWAMFAGKRAIPERPVRKGADKSRLKVTIGDENGKPMLVATRVIHIDRTTELKIEAAPGVERPIGTPQAVLDALIGEMSFDPIAFIQMSPKNQVEQLRKIVTIDADLDQLARQNEADYSTRTQVNRDVARLETEVNAIAVQPGLPAEKIDDAEILEKIKAVDETNRIARETDFHKGQAQNIAAEFRRRTNEYAEGVDALEKQIEQLLGELHGRKAKLSEMTIEAEKADAQAAGMPSGIFADVTALTQELQNAQTANREIEKRARRQQLEDQLAAKRREAQTLTRLMESREEQKADAISKAKMPVEGLTFNENGVLFNGFPLQQLGEAEQIRVAAGLAMAANPKLRAIPIHHGESLDDHSLALLEQLAEEKDFQIFMARVDTSGNVGIVLSDGMVEKENA